MQIAIVTVGAIAGEDIIRCIDSMHRTVTVIIPAFDLEQTIGAALQSVLQQTAPPAEIIVVDDGSTDGTRDRVRELAAAHPERIRLIEAAHGGPAAARNRGIAEARGEWISFLDGDDLWMREKLERVVELLDDTADIVAHDQRERTLQGRESVIAFHTRYDASLPLFPQLYSVNFLATSCVTVRRDWLGSGFEPSFAPNEDYELWLRLASAGARLSMIPEPLTVYVRRSGGISLRIWKRYRSSLRIAHAYAEALIPVVGRARAWAMRFRRVLLVHHIVWSQRHSAARRSDYVKICFRAPLEVLRALVAPIRAAR